MVYLTTLKQYRSRKANMVTNKLYAVQNLHNAPISYAHLQVYTSGF